MRGDAIFGDLMHACRSDLGFDALAGGADDGGMNGSVVVLLGRRDIVLEASRNHRPAGMNDAERPVAVADAVDDDAESEYVRQLFEGQGSRLHLAENRIGLLLPTGDRRLEAVFLEQVGKLRLNLADQTVVFLRQFLQPLGDGFVGLRVDVAKRQFLQLLTHVLHAHASGQRRIDLHRLLGDAGAFFPAAPIPGCACCAADPQA